MAEDIKLDKNLTINQVLQLTGRGQTGTLKQAIQNAGLSLNDKFSRMRETAFLKKLNEVGVEGHFTELNAVENSLREMFDISDDAGEFPLKKKTFGAKSKSRSKTLNLKKADQARKAIKVELPSIKEINQSIHTATQRLIAQGDTATKKQKLKDATKFYEAAALLQIKHHSGLRTTEIVNLTTGKPAEGAKYGTVVRGSDTLVQISNKGDRTNFRLSSMPMGILQDLAERNASNDLNKSAKLFKTGKGTLESTINEAVNDVFKQNELIIRDQDTGLSKKFTVGLLRKNVFSAIDDEFGTGVANRVLGHSIKGDVGLTHYKVTRTSRAKLDINTLAAERFNSTYLADIGQSSPKAVMSSYKFGENFFPTEPVAKLVTPSPVEEAAQKTGLNLETKSVQVGANVDNLLKDTNKNIGQLEKQLDKLQGLQTQVDDLKKDSKTKKSLLETPSSSDDISQSIKDKLGKFGIFLGKKLPLVAAGIVYAEQKEAGASTATALGYAGSEFLPVSASDVDTAGAFVTKARQEGLPEAIGLDTEKQKQMNITRKQRLADRVRQNTSVTPPLEEGFINQNQMGE